MRAPAYYRSRRGGALRKDVRGAGSRRRRRGVRCVSGRGPSGRGPGRDVRRCGGRRRGRREPTPFTEAAMRAANIALLTKFCPALAKCDPISSTPVRFDGVVHARGQARRRPARGLRLRLAQHPRCDSRLRRRSRPVELRDVPRLLLRERAVACRVQYVLLRNAAQRQSVRRRQPVRERCLLCASHPDERMRSMRRPTARRRALRVLLRLRARLAMRSVRAPPSPRARR